ncbi:MAG TPA: hypothetical protein VGC17_04400 [Lactovum miscens]|uniref:hypothetical protein n=1 Tax=Lactovum miscens TaxID=190387 RepID=UPI002ED97BEB
MRKAIIIFTSLIIVMIAVFGVLLMSITKSNDKDVAALQNSLNQMQLSESVMINQANDFTEKSGSLSQALASAQTEIQSRSVEMASQTSIIASLQSISQKNVDALKSAQSSFTSAQSSISSALSSAVVNKK